MEFKKGRFYKLTVKNTGRTWVLECLEANTPIGDAGLICTNVKFYVPEGDETAELSDKELQIMIKRDAGIKFELMENKVEIAKAQLHGFREE